MVNSANCRIDKDDHSCYNVIKGEKIATGVHLYGATLRLSGGAISGEFLFYIIRNISLS